MRVSCRCSRLRSTASPMMPAFLVTVGPTRSGVRVSVESSVNLAVSRSSGSDQERVRTRQGIAVLVEVAEERQAPLLEAAGAVVVLPAESRDVVIDQLGRRGVIAHDDEARGHGDLLLLPQRERLLVVAVERLERRL